ncbi:MAG TPA: carbon storage regulator CsrA [Candidatus Hydrogenedentes bacterium]|nr:carbon storage regulator CsrA [Candidatus Hydrogenedentota bacterium]HOK88884.1 carbon storage regulator CsrA [Candidatus Hydrogenedentota bacterium]HOV59521.1 carbon storage regulator CsrA [Candidatus Hydrogenedentota bacterium]
MLVLTRKENESIMIGNDIEVKILDLKDNQCKIGVIAPRSIPVHRMEVYLAIQAENAQAASAGQSLEQLNKIMPRKEGK